jgi:hypothetical protein
MQAVLHGSDIVGTTQELSWGSALLRLGGLVQAGFHRSWTGVASDEFNQKPCLAHPRMLQLEGTIARMPRSSAKACTDFLRNYVA